MRLDIAAGHRGAVRAGTRPRDVQLVALAGKTRRLRFPRRRDGGSCESDGLRGLNNVSEDKSVPSMPTCFGPHHRRTGWAAGPIPTSIIEVEKDFTTYGEEVKFGGWQGDP